MLANRPHHFENLFNYVKIINTFEKNNSNLLGHPVKNKKIGIWYKKLKFKNQKLNKQNIEKIFFKNLFKIGYRYFHKQIRSKNDLHIIEAFQRRFLPNKVTGKIDQKTLKISHFLANNLKN